MFKHALQIADIWVLRGVTKYLYLFYIDII